MLRPETMIRCDLQLREYANLPFQYFPKNKYSNVEELTPALVQPQVQHNLRNFQSILK